MPDLISRVTDAVLREVREWQSRASERVYPIIIFDAPRVKIRDADSRTKAVYAALGVPRDGLRAVLGLWVADSERAKAWLSVMNELRNRGVRNVLIVVMDGPEVPRGDHGGLSASHGPDLPPAPFVELLRTERLQHSHRRSAPDLRDN